MKKSHLISSIVIGMIMVIGFVPDLHAQYNTAIGIRIGGTTGVTAKHFYKPAAAWEGIIGTFGNGFSLTGLMEKYEPIYNATGFYLFYGGGIHLAFYNGNDRYSYFGREINDWKKNDVGLGINGIVGIEYRMPDDIPLSFSIDLKPFVEFGSGGYVSIAPDPSIGIKFLF